MKKVIKAIIILSIFFTGLSIVYKNKKDIQTYEVKEWENIYNENSIQLYYADLEDSRLGIINSTYKIDEFMEKEENELAKVFKAVDILHNIKKYNPTVNDVEAFNGYDILRLKGLDEQVSFRDLALIMRDILNSAGIKSRIGIFRSEKDKFTKEQAYYVVEYWSEENNKWVMIDFIDKGYFTKSNEPLSGIELVNNNIKNTNYLGNSSKNNYLKDKNSIFDTYSIAIDNTLDMEKSNTFITYFNDKDKINIEYKENYLPPTIYTKTESLFLAAPTDKAVLSDTEAYIILMKADGENDTFIIGAFQNSKIIKNYFLSINNKEYYRINDYETMDFKAGLNTISLSLNGEDEVARIEIKYNPNQKKTEEKKDKK